MASLAAIEWQGTVEPSNAEVGDYWLNTETWVRYILTESGWEADLIFFSDDRP